MNKVDNMANPDALPILFILKGNKYLDDTKARPRILITSLLGKTCINYIVVACRIYHRREVTESTETLVYA